MALKYRRMAVWAACFLFAGAACADTLWLQKDGERLKVLAGELHSPTAMPTLRDARPLLAGGQQAALDAAPDYYAFAAGEGDLRGKKKKGRPFLELCGLQCGPPDRNRTCI